MGTQKAIAKQTHDKEGHYVLALKENQGTLNEDTRLFLEAEFKKNHPRVLAIAMKRLIKDMAALKCADAL